ncbi:adenylate/guanylate cyclase domain-containing protein [Legionella waltersii]|uniref:Guanylate cyclase n=1 Tax=Legionella waltersii TaxID=66969 RepID=A0A0W1AAZ3_9GAMM|nr:adenylate/guanylate cyclase domain-containing protein [Legionella waltersii]KTD78320.1 guanylate cyclase [Legionella waltersii]SNV08727.1 guanylate cyclase [Legionella waltersii]
MDKEKSNILYVDDETNNLTAFVATFRRHFNVFTATSGQEGLEVMRQNKIHIVITDQRMPEMTGVQFLESIIPEYPNTIRMILTGFTDIEAIIKAINTGRVFRYITKPWDPADLKMSIDTGLKVVQLEEERTVLIEKLNNEVIKQKRILDLFQKYVPKNVVDEIINEDEDSPLMHGEYRIVSVLFADIRQFTSLSDHLGPVKTVELLNTYFAIMNQKVQENHGIVNKLIGDGVLALFGAPVSHIDNHLNAVRCGLAMIEALKILNDKYSAELGHEIHLGIGINTGEVIVGNIGTIEHMEYSVIGDTVNTASRIEELTKDNPNAVFISESTYKATAKHILVEELGPQIIRGKEDKINLYKVIGLKP